MVTSKGLPEGEFSVETVQGYFQGVLEAEIEILRRRGSLGSCASDIMYNRKKAQATVPLSMYREQLYKSENCSLPLE